MKRTTDGQSFSWLHFSNWRLGRNQIVNSRAFLDALREDLTDLEKQHGSWDAIILAGDMVSSARPEGYGQLDRELSTLLRDLESDPAVIAVPGNHDVRRPQSPSAEERLLGFWSRDPSIPEEFWRRAS